MKEKICVIMTGGTICSLTGINGKGHSCGEKTGVRLIEDYLSTEDSPFRLLVDFDIRSLSPDILSENMTFYALGDLLKIFKEEIDYDSYKGIIVLHGTDTLAYTSAFLSFALAGIKIPVCMVSSHMKLGDMNEDGSWNRNRETNGYANFRASVELIMNGIAPNVYAVYRNDDEGKGEMLLHYGSHLAPSPNFRNDFHSIDEMKIPDTSNARLEGRAFESGDSLFCRTKETSANLLLIRPYTGLNYAALKTDGVFAVIHGSYHAESVCIGRAKEEHRRDSDNFKLHEIRDREQPYSILYLLEDCKKKRIPVIIAPCSREDSPYGTTVNAIEEGALPLANISAETAYAKAALACALGIKKEELYSFMKKSINYEFLQKQ